MVLKGEEEAYSKRGSSNSKKKGRGIFELAEGREREIW